MHVIVSVFVKQINIKQRTHRYRCTVQTVAFILLWCLQSLRSSDGDLLTVPRSVLMVVIVVPVFGTSYLLTWDQLLLCLQLKTDLHSGAFSIMSCFTLFILCCLVIVLYTMLIEFACDEICYINIIGIAVYPPPPLPKRQKLCPEKKPNEKDLHSKILLNKGGT